MENFQCSISVWRKILTLFLSSFATADVDIYYIHLFLVIQDSVARCGTGVSQARVWRAHQLWF